MHLFLGWRAMEDRAGHLGHTIERFLWGDGRARHTFLLASTNEHPLVLVEIDVGDHREGIRKSMKLNIVELNEIPENLAQVVFIGHVKSSMAFHDLLRSAHDYVHKNPNYHVLFNNCRTFVEYLIDHIPELHQSIPRKNGSILEYYHDQAKHEHPGAIVLSKKFLKKIRDLHQNHKISKCIDLSMLDMQNPQSNSVDTISTDNA